MRTDNTLRLDAMNLLIKELGEVEAERFIYLVRRDSFDYTEWQRNLWNDMTVDEVFALAADREKTRDS
jgi:hypothetical protein